MSKPIFRLTLEEARAEPLASDPGDMAARDAASTDWAAEAEGGR